MFFIRKSQFNIRQMFSNQPDCGDFLQLPKRHIFTFEMEVVAKCSYSMATHGLLLFS